MLYPRIIPCLLIQDGGLVKTINFKNPTYVGDPINAVKIFNEKEVDELIVLDIDATINSHEPNFKLIEQLAAECRMPLCYGGGITTVNQIQKIISLGVEKVSICSSTVENQKLLLDGAEIVGSQSIVGAIDIVKKNKNYFVSKNAGDKIMDIDPEDLILKYIDSNVGEIFINFVNEDGEMNGYDYEYIDKIYSKINVPLTVIGGAGKLDDFKKLFKKFNLIGAAAGSYFVFKGIYKAVLINYISKEDKLKLFKNTYV
jgi:cyclase